MGKSTDRITKRTISSLEKEISSLNNKLEKIKNEKNSMRSRLYYITKEYNKVKEDLETTLELIFGTEVVMNEITKKVSSPRGSYDKSNKSLVEKSIGGFIRHYKSGKEVMVRPFKRGVWVNNN